MSFIDELSNEVSITLKKLEEIPIIEPSEDPKAKVISLLKIALKNEIEASEIAAFWMHSTPEIDTKLGLARQCGDEAKHYRLIEKRLVELGFQTESFSPLVAGYSPLFQWLKTLETTVERIAAGPFAREAIAIKRNAQFVMMLESSGDPVSGAIYREHIQPDEEWHHNFGRAILIKYATTTELQEKARNAALQTLKLADELREMAIKNTGTCAIPGC
jgi:1,2-phenylacetyl-CoA epoxidase catalytic subunit